MSEVIDATGWTFEEYDASERKRVTQMLVYRGTKSAIIAEKREWDSKSVRR